jgi:hypothetical protein
MRRHVIREQRRGERRADAGRRRDILNGKRQAVQRAGRLAPQHGSFSPLGLAHCLLSGKRHDRIQAWIQVRDDF